MKNITRIALAAALLSGSAFTALATEQAHPKQQIWAFDGMFGHVDRQAAQRGFQVYKEVCSACHSLKRVAFRNLEDLGFSEAEVKTLAASYEMTDGPNDEGEMFKRPGIPADHFPSPFLNEQAARAANNGAAPPDLSLIVKARHDGANYIYSLLTGYEEPPAGVKAPRDGLHYNPYFPGGFLAMPQPISDGQVSYEDGTKASVDQMTHDVVTFLQWAAEPEMEHRKALGVKVMLFLTIFCVFMYLAKKRIWHRLEE